MKLVLDDGCYRNNGRGYVSRNLLHALFPDCRDEPVVELSIRPVAGHPVGAPGMDMAAVLFEGRRAVIPFGVGEHRIYELYGKQRGGELHPEYLCSVLADDDEGLWTDMLMLAGDHGFVRLDAAVVPQGKPERTDPERIDRELSVEAGESCYLAEGPYICRSSLELLFKSGPGQAPRGALRLHVSIRRDPFPGATEVSFGNQEECLAEKVHLRGPIATFLENEVVGLHTELYADLCRVAGKGRRPVWLRVNEIS